MKNRSPVSRSVVGSVVPVLYCPWNEASEAEADDAEVAAEVAGGVAAAVAEAALLVSEVAAAVLWLFAVSLRAFTCRLSGLACCSGVRASISRRRTSCGTCGGCGLGCCRRC